MPLAARHIDVSDENVPFVVTFKSPFTAGAKLFIKYSVDGVQQQEKELTASGAGHPVVQFDVPEGSEVEYQIIERVSGQQDRARGKKRKETAGAAPTAAPSVTPAAPSHTPGTPAASATPASDPDAKVKEFSAKLLAALHNPDMSIENVLAILDELELEMQKRPQDVKKRTLAGLSVGFGNMSSLAPVVRDQFKNKPPCVNVDDLKDRLEQGSDKFRHGVYLKMKADPEASKAFHIKAGPFDPEDPFGSGKLNRIFDVACFKYDLGGRRSAARIGAALETIDPVSPTDPEGDRERIALLGPVLERRALKKPGLFGKLRANKLDNLLHLAVQAGGMLTIAGGGWALGAGMMLAPSFLEAMSGVRSRDVIKAMQNPSKLQGVKDLWGTFAKNFGLFDWIKSDKSALQVFAERAAHVLRNAVPVLGPLALRRDVSIGGYEDTEEVVKTAEKRDRDLVALVGKFAAAEAGGGSTAPSTAPSVPAAAPASASATATPPASH